MKTLKNIINSACIGVVVTSFIVPDEGKRRTKIVVRGDNKSYIDDSGETADVGVPLTDKLPPNAPFCHKLVSDV